MCIRDSSKFVYKSDQESSIKAVMLEALKSVMTEAARKTGTSADYVPVPENSAVGSSASNGRAERTVQAIEDLVRCYKAALEAHLDWKIPVGHAVIRWLVEHAADVMNKMAINKSGHTPYEELHGRKAKERRAEFGERVFYSTPRKGRAKLDLRWKLGAYLGQSDSSNEAFVGT